VPYLADRVKETTTTTGTGAITLGGAVPDFQSFATAFGANSVVVSYCIDDGISNWEVGDGTFNGTTSLTRDVVRASTNGGALVNFGAGTKLVWCDFSAKLCRNSLTGSQYALARGFAMP
jgi:hypothetical protein